jgi:hypothetical protein
MTVSSRKISGHCVEIDVEENTAIIRIVDSGPVSNAERTRVKKAAQQLIEDNRKQSRRPIIGLVHVNEVVVECPEPATA